MREGSTEVSGDDFPLSVGSSGDNVIYLQYGLHILCCSPGGIDGVFGSGTETAVINFQNKYSLGADGIVGTGTWSKMQSLITEIQQALANKGYSVGVVDGVAGEATYSQIMAFQAAQGLIADGQVGPSTSAALGITSSGGASSSATDNFPLSVGSSGPYVLYLQYGLYINCINPNGVDGTFGEGTKTAVEKFQSQNGLAVDGIVTTEVWETLRNIILPIQQLLNNRGYDTGGIDGIAGEATYNAVIAFQQAASLSADGQVGSATMAALQGEAAGTGGTVSATLSKGSSGSMTRYLQHLLYALGYDVNIDGVFGTTTYNAVVQFQNDHGLDADGVVGGGTWSTLFSTYQVPAAGSGVTKFVGVAQHELSWGFAEDNANNITPYGQWYGMQDAWCAMFVSYCAYQAGILGSVVPMFAYCPYGVSWYREQGRFYSRDGGYDPKVGDTIFYFNAATNEISHTGIVVGVSADSVTTVEGNSSDKVCSHVYNKTNTYIYGYGANGGTSGSTEEPEEPQKPSNEEIDDALKKKWMQILKSSAYFNAAINYTYDEELTLFNSTNLKITTVFGEDSIYTNADATASFEITNGNIFSSNIDMLSLLQSEYGVDINTEAFESIINMSVIIGNGHGKFTFSTDGTWVKLSYTVLSSVDVNEMFSASYSFQLNIYLLPPSDAFLPNPGPVYSVNEAVDLVGSITRTAAVISLIYLFGIELGGLAAIAAAGAVVVDTAVTIWHAFCGLVSILFK